MNKITQEELYRRFPDGVPMRIVSLIFDSPPEWTIQQVRDAIDAAAADMVRRPTKALGQTAYEATPAAMTWEALPKSSRELWRVTEIAVLCDAIGIINQQRVHYLTQDDVAAAEAVEMAIDLLRSRTIDP